MNFIPSEAAEVLKEMGVGSNPFFHPPEKLAITDDGGGGKTGQAILSSALASLEPLANVGRLGDRNDQPLPQNVSRIIQKKSKANGER